MVYIFLKVGILYNFALKNSPGCRYGTFALSLSTFVTLPMTTRQSVLLFSWESSSRPSLSWSFWRIGVGKGVIRGDPHYWECCTNTTSQVLSGTGTKHIACNTPVLFFHISTVLPHYAFIKSINLYWQVKLLLAIVFLPCLRTQRKKLG